MEKHSPSCALAEVLKDPRLFNVIRDEIRSLLLVDLNHVDLIADRVAKAVEDYQHDDSE